MWAGSFSCRNCDVAGVFSYFCYYAIKPFEQPLGTMYTKENGPEIMIKILCFTIVIVLHDCVNANPCPEATVNYNNESCYVFVGEDVTRYLYNEIWKEEKKVAKKVACMSDTCSANVRLQPGRTRGVHHHDIDGCVWNKQQALKVCQYMHLVNVSSDPLHKLAPYNNKWHLPIIETYEEDEWLNEQLNKGKNKILGTHFWIDLVELGGRYVWESTGELADWIHLPDGFDRWWEKNNVLMEPRPGETKMCYEYHTDYGDTKKPEQLPTDRKPHIPIEVYGWHPRACEGAYEQESQLDTPEDFSALEEYYARKYWFGLVPRQWCGRDGRHCVIPGDHQKRKRKPSSVFVIPYVVEKITFRTAECRTKAIAFHEDKFRMLLAPTGVVCETSIKCIKDPNNRKCEVADASHQKPFPY